MRVSPINYSYSRSGIKRTNSPEPTTNQETKNISFNSFNRAGGYVPTVQNYKDCFNRAFTFEVLTKSDFNAVYERMIHWIKTTAKIPATGFSTNFNAMLYDVKYEKKLDRYGGLAILAREYGTGSILAYGDPKENVISFLPPGNNFNPRNWSPDKIPHVDFSHDVEEKEYAFTTYNYYPDEIEYTKIWASTGQPKETFSSYNGYTQRNRYYNSDGSENTLKNFFLGT